jgi:hypothetical protein
VFAGTFNVRDAYVTVDIAIGTETLGNLIAERVRLRPFDDAIPLPTTDVEPNQPGAV